MFKLVPSYLTLLSWSHTQPELLLSPEFWSLSKSPKTLENKVQNPLHDAAHAAWHHTSPPASFSLSSFFKLQRYFWGLNCASFFFFFLQTFFTREDHVENWPLVTYFSPRAPEPSSVKLLHLILKLIFISCKTLQVCTRTSLSSGVNVYVYKGGLRYTQTYALRWAPKRLSSQSFQEPSD